MRGETLVDQEALSIPGKRHLVSRVLESESFRKAPRLREFLLYVAECSLEQRLDEVREQVIAEKVFGRKAEYYDQQDSIVRAEARNLRRRLERYFTAEGAHEPVVILMPKGGYALAFVDRGALDPTALALQHSPSAVQTPRPAALVRSPASLAPQPYNSARVYRGVCAALLATSICAITVAIHWRGIAKAETARPTAPFPFSSLFADSLDTYIVTSDTAVLQMLRLSGKTTSLSDYLIRAYPALPNVAPANLVDMLNRTEYTDGNEMAMAGAIMRKNAARLGRTFLRSGHSVQLSDFTHSNVILIGSPLSNPWAFLYADRVNFSFDLLPERGIVLRNKARRQGELAEYPSADDANHHWAYADIAFIPSDSGSALLIAGTTAGATAAAGEFVLDGVRFSKALRSAGIQTGNPPQPFELLLRATTFLGGATESKVITWRTNRGAGS